MQNSKVVKSLTIARQNIDTALAGLGAEAKQPAQRTPAPTKSRSARKAA